MMPWIVPFSTRSAMSRLARTGPKLLEMPTSSIAASVMAPLSLGVLPAHSRQIAGSLSISHENPRFTKARDGEVGVTDATERLDALEMRMAEQDRVIDELSEELGKAWKALERMQARLSGMDNRFASLEDALPPPPITKPPHW
ncbi:MAG: hypothetical protein DI629_01045 [Mesorhizobium amorphae]|nr:MAG: hypothetical protein DI629_01045 [Mesorhizobium amorphae]